MCCELEIWARIRSAAAGRAPQPDMHMVIQGTLDGTSETQP